APSRATSTSTRTRRSSVDGATCTTSSRPARRRRSCPGATTAPSTPATGAHLAPIAARRAVPCTASGAVRRGRRWPSCAPTAAPSAARRGSCRCRAAPGPEPSGRLLEGRLERDRLRLRAARDRERRCGARRDDERTEPHGRVHPVDERGAARVAAVVGEDRGQDGDAEDAAELAHGVVGAGGLTLLLAAHGSEDHVG